MTTKPKYKQTQTCSIAIAIMELLCPIPPNSPKTPTIIFKLSISKSKTTNQIQKNSQNHSTFSQNHYLRQKLTRHTHKGIL